MSSLPFTIARLASLFLCLLLGSCGLVVGLVDLIGQSPPGDGGFPNDLDGGNIDDVDGGLMDDVDGGAIDAGGAPCSDCANDERCVQNANPRYCAKTCAVGFDNEEVLYVLSSCAGGESCVLENGVWLCRDDLTVAAPTCTGNERCLNNGIGFRGCVDDTPALVICSLGCSVIDNDCRVSSDAIADWECGLENYGTADGCDCGCGVPDPDCADDTLASCMWCGDCLLNGDECRCDWPDGVCDSPINPDDNTQCD